MIAMIRYVDLSAFVHTHASWVPDLPFRFSPRAELEQKATTSIKNLVEEYRLYIYRAYKRVSLKTFTVIWLSVVPEKSLHVNSFPLASHWKEYLNAMVVMI